MEGVYNVDIHPKYNLLNTAESEEINIERVENSEKIV